MRVGFDAKRAFLNRSGLGNYSRDIIYSMHQKYPEHEYFLYTPKKDKFLQVAEGDSIRHITAPDGYGKLRQALWRTYGLSKQVKRDRLEIYHGLSNELPAKIAFSGAKTVVTIHDLIFMRYPEWYKPIDRAIYRRKFSYSSRISDRVISASKQTKNDLIEFFGIEEHKIRVIYQGCNPEFSRKLDDQQKKVLKEKWNLPSEYLLYVGTVEERKNLLNLIKAIYYKGIQMPLVVVGRPTHYSRKVKAFIQENRLKHIIFLEEVSVTDLPGIYQSAKVFIYPSVFEGFGIPILEAMLSGVPVITSKGGCFSEVGGDSSIYINPFNPEELGDALQNLLSDTALQKKMILDGTQHAALFSNDTIAENIMELYKELVYD